MWEIWTIRDTKRRDEVDGSAQHSIPQNDWDATPVDNVSVHCWGNTKPL